MRKYVLPFAIVIAILVIAIPVLAAGPASYESTVNITNISGSSGTVTLDYYDNLGVVTATYTETISGYETKFYTTLPGLAGSFDGAMIVSANVPIAANSVIIGKDGSDNPINYASYVGISVGAPSLYLPLLMDENAGYSTYYSVQNTSGSPVDVDITYDDGTTASITALEPGASVTINNKDEVHTKKVLSAELVSTGNIAATVVEFGEDGVNAPLYAYNGFGAGSLDPFFGLVNENNYGYWTSVIVQNLGAVDSDVTLQYAPNAIFGTPCTETRTIPAGGKRIYATYAFAFDNQTTDNDCVMGEKFVGVATVMTNTASVPLVGIVNQLNDTGGVIKGAALMSLNRSTATSTVLFPEIYQWYGTWNWWSSVTIINLSGFSLPLNDVTCRAVGTNNVGPVDTTWTNDTKVIDNNAGWAQQFYQNKPTLGNGFIGTVSCTSATGTITGSSNTLGAGAPDDIDTLGVYEGISVSP